jgi:hypothetical protein
MKLCENKLNKNSAISMHWLRTIDQLVTFLGYAKGIDHGTTYNNPTAATAF